MVWFGQTESHQPVSLCVLQKPRTLCGLIRMATVYDETRSSGVACVGRLVRLCVWALVRTHKMLIGTYGLNSLYLLLELYCIVCCETKVKRDL